jgi:NAD(P)-dependent dehydrogenase (short-subunit alcohol dehydrogenase family)
VRDFSGRVAVVTGAASGIGRAVAEALADAGCDVALCDIDADGLTEVGARIEQRGRKASLHVVDVADRAAMKALPDQVEAEHGRVDILVNNAGVSVASTLEEHTLEDFEWIVGINFWGVVHGCKFFLPLLRRSDAAYIVNLSSVFGFIGLPGQSSYCATKFAVRGFSEAIAAELADTNIGVMSVHPGGIRTNIVKATRWAEGHVGARDRTVRLFERFAMLPEKAAAQILRGMRRNASRVLITPEAHVTDYVKRLFPVLPRSWIARTHTWITR